MRALKLNYPNAFYAPRLNEQIMARSQGPRKMQ